MYLRENFEKDFATRTSNCQARCIAPLKRGANDFFIECGAPSFLRGLSSSMHNHQIFFEKHICLWRNTLFFEIWMLNPLQDLFLLKKNIEIWRKTPLWEEDVMLMAFSFSFSFAFSFSTNILFSFVFVKQLALTTARTASNQCCENQSNYRAKKVKMSNR